MVKTDDICLYVKEKHKWKKKGERKEKRKRTRKCGEQNNDVQPILTCPNAAK